MNDKMRKKTLPYRRGTLAFGPGGGFRRFFLLLLAAGCLAACKTEPDLPDDPHSTLVNPFTGVWKEEATGEYWQFRPDGTGGRAAAEAGSFPGDFSFFVYAGQDVQTVPLHGSLVMLSDDPDNTNSVTFTLYDFSIEGNQASLTPVPVSTAVELKRVSGRPEALSLTNPLIGEWSAQWSNEHGPAWSLKYRSDGTVKMYHHQAGHQFENAYALRENTLVIFGAWRFSAPVIADFSDLGNGTWQITEKQSSPVPAEWIYTKVAASEWL